jgi:hypothetical protein
MIGEIRCGESGHEATPQPGVEKLLDFHGVQDPLLGHSLELAEELSMEHSSVACPKSFKSTKVLVSSGAPRIAQRSR